MPPGKIGMLSRMTRRRPLVVCLGWSVKMVELAFAFGFPVALLMSLARPKDLALSNVDLDTDEGI